MYAPQHLSPVNLNFLVDTGYTHNLLSKASFDRLPASLREGLEPWNTAAMLADGSVLPVYVKLSWQVESGTRFLRRVSTLSDL